MKKLKEEEAITEMETIALADTGRNNVHIFMLSN